MRLDLRRCCLYTVAVLFVAVVGPGAAAALAHPGRTASDGCHYCRTNCASWGVPQDQRHCHNGGGGGSGTSGGSAPPADTTPPPDPRVGSATVDGSTVELTASAEAGSTIRVLSGGSVVATARATGEQQTLSFRLADGTHRLEVHARDAAGNTSGTVTRTVVVDTVAPDAATVTATVPVSAAHPWVEVTVAGERGATWQARAVAASSAGAEPTVAEGRIPAVGPAETRLLLANGSYTLSVTLEDAAGNTSAETTHEVSVALPAPSPPTLTVASDEGANPVEVAVSGPPLGTVTVAVVVADRGLRPEEVSLDEDGAGTVSVDLDDGSHTLSATASDFQGQGSAAASTVEVLVDTTAPQFDVSVDREALAAGRVVWSVRTEPGADVTVSSPSAGVDERFVAGPEARSGQVEAAAGEHTLTVTVTDPYGNTAEEVVAVAIVASASLADALLGFAVLGGLGYGGWRLVRRRRDDGELADGGPESGTAHESEPAAPDRAPTNHEIAAEDEPPWQP